MILGALTFIFLSIYLVEVFVYEADGEFMFKALAMVALPFMLPFIALAFFNKELEGDKDD